MEEKYIIYEHVNLINKKRYIGVTKQKPEKRWKNGHGYCRNKEFYDDIIKYGWLVNFQHNILYTDLTSEEAYQKETELIRQYNLTDPRYGYNKAKGGQLGPKDFESMIKWSRTHKRFGEDNVNSKKVQCIETGDVFGSIAEANRWCGTTKVGECCRGLRDHAGTHPETKQKLTWRYVSNDTPVTEYCHNQNIELKNPIKKVQCIDTGEIFNNATEASKFYNIAVCNILRVCKGERKTAGNKRWQFIEEKE